MGWDGMGWDGMGWDGDGDGDGIELMELIWKWMELNRIGLD